eukprot:gene21345-28280_t
MRGTGGSSGFKAWSASQDGSDAAALCRALSAGAGGVQQQHGSGSMRFALVAYSYGSCAAAEALDPSYNLNVVAYVSVGFPLGMLSKWFLRSHSSWIAMVKAGTPVRSSQSGKPVKSHSAGTGASAGIGTTDTGTGASAGTGTSYANDSKGSASAASTHSTHAAMLGIPRLLVMGTSDQFTCLETIQELVKEAKDAPDGTPGCSSSSAGGASLGASSDRVCAPLDLHVMEGCDHFSWGPALGQTVIEWIRNSMMT